MVRRFAPPGQLTLDSQHPMMRMSTLVVAMVMVLGGCAVQTQEEIPLFLLIVRERVRLGTEEAYDKNELQLAAVCARLRCPHPYLALASATGAREIWWLNAFTSPEERDGLDAAYARNKPLMAEMLPLGKRKEDFREAFTRTPTSYRRDLSGGAVLRITGVRFFVIDTTRRNRAAMGAVFESSDGDQFAITSASTRADAENAATRSGPGALILAVQPQWSFPAEAWIKADPVFWRMNPVAQRRGTSRGSQ